MCLTIGFSVGCLALLGNGLLDAIGRVESSLLGFGAVSSSVNSGEASLASLGLEMGVFWRAGFGRFFLTPVILLRFAYSLFVNNYVQPLGCIA